MLSWLMLLARRQQKVISKSNESIFITSHSFTLSHTHKCGLLSYYLSENRWVHKVLYTSIIFTANLKPSQTVKIVQNRTRDNYFWAISFSFSPIRCFDSIELNQGPSRAKMWKKWHYRMHKIKAPYIFLCTSDKKLVILVYLFNLKVFVFEHFGLDTSLIPVWDPCFDPFVFIICIFK